MAKSKAFKKFKRKILHSWLVTKIIIQLIYWYVKLIGFTTKWKFKGFENADTLWKEHQTFVGIAWHSRAVMIPVFGNDNPISALVSLHQDGQLIAGLLHKFNVDTVGGSSNQNASGSALSLMRKLKSNHPVFIIPDGPRGPRMHMGMSPIYLAQKNNCPIICITYSIKGSKIFEKSWDKIMLPIPFSKGIFIASKPIYIPQEAGKEELEKYRRKVEKIMIDIQHEADDYTGMKRTYPSEKPKKQRKEVKKK